MSVDVSVSFWTRDPSIKLNENNLYKIRIPKDSTVLDLSDIINHLLNNESNSEYGFVINNLLLQNNLKEASLTMEEMNKKNKDTNDEIDYNLEEDIELSIEYFLKSNECTPEIINLEDDWIRCIINGKNKSILATGSFDSTIRIYSQAQNYKHQNEQKEMEIKNNNEKSISLLQGHSQCITALEAINDFEFISCSNDTNARWWQNRKDPMHSNDNFLNTRIFIGNNYPITTIKYHPEFNQIIAGTFDGHLLLWNIDNLIIQQTLTQTNDKKEENSKRKKMKSNSASLSISIEKDAKDFNNSNDKNNNSNNSNNNFDENIPKYHPNQIIKAHDNCLSEIHFYNNQIFYTCSLDGKLKAWSQSLNDCQEIELLKQSFPEAITCMDIWNDKILLGHPSGNVRLINIPSSFNSFSIQNDNNNPNQDQNDQKKNIENDNIQIIKNIHSGWISCARWINNFEFISTGYDGKALIWNLNYSNRPKHVLLELNEFKKIFACKLARNHDNYNQNQNENENQNENKDIKSQEKNSQITIYIGGENKKLYKFNINSII